MYWTARGTSMSKEEATFLKEIIQALIKSASDLAGDATGAAQDFWLSCKNALEELLRAINQKKLIELGYQDYLTTVERYYNLRVTSACVRRKVLDRLKAMAKADFEAKRTPEPLTGDDVDALFYRAVLECAAPVEL